MKHRIPYRKLSRPTAQRLSLFRNQITSLIKHDGIVTTVAKAKELRRFADWIVTLSKKGTLHSRRQLAAFVYEKGATKHAFETFPLRFADRQGGYTRLTYHPLPRRGDGAKMAKIEYIDKDKIPTEEQVQEYRENLKQAVLDERRNMIEEKRERMEKKE